MKWSIERTATTGFGLALVMVVAIGVVAYRSGQDFIETNRLVTHTIEILGGLEATISDVVNAESGQRGYIITGDESYLEPPPIVAARLNGRLQHLRVLTADNPDQQDRLDALEVLIGQRLDLIEDTTALREQEGFESTQAVVLQGRGKQLMTRIRHVVDAMKDEEHGLLKSRRAQSEATARNTFLTFSIFTIGAVGLLTYVFMLINRDITGRRRAEVAARRYADEVRDLYDNAPCGYHSVDENATFVQINQTELDWLGYTRDEVIGKLKFSDVITDRSLAVMGDNFPLIKERGWVSDLEFEMKRKDGSTFTVLLNATAVTDEEGEFLRTRSTAVDITDRKHFEDALRVSEERWRSLVKNAPDVIITLDLDGCIQFANRLPANVRPEDVLGKRVFDVILPEQRDRLVKALETVRHTGEATSLELTGTLSGKHYINHIGPIHVNGKLVGFISTSSDITERKHIEEQIQKLNRDLERRTIDLEAINEELEAFTYSVSHDLRAPLRAMSGFSRQLHDKYRDDLPERAQHFLVRIQQNAERMGHLIDDLLTLSRFGRQALGKRTVNPRRVVGDILRELNTAEEYPKTRIVVDDLPLCQADPTLLKQAYLNLLTNALKFSSRNDAPYIHVGFLHEKGECIYFVKDNGVGFDMQYADKLFGVFERMHSSNEFDGTGVGLAIVQRIVHRHGGRVWADAAPDQGAAFYFTLQGEPEYADG
jgi:PAS domain S-box-containing protein